jgi:NADPH-dependent 2,4-dienoyl-CoA reductase/sulfur reductase-like enzyme
MTESIDLAVVGAGPAGLAAAAEAASLSLPLTLMDTFHLPGGQYYKQTPPTLGATEAPDDYARQLLGVVAGDSVRLLAGTSVWGIFPEAPPEGGRSDGGYLLCLYGPPGTPRRLKAQTVILAPGA